MKTIQRNSDSLQHEFARSVEEVRQEHRPAHQGGAILHAATAARAETAQEMLDPSRRHQARQHSGQRE